jgi:hypothetical protein
LKKDISPLDPKQYKYESPYLKNVGNNVNLNKPQQNVVLQKNNVIANNNVNMRPISSKVDNQRIIINNPNNIVSSNKKVVVPDRKIGNQIKVSENLIKNNNYNYNYNNMKNNAQAQNNLVRPSSGHRGDPVKVMGNPGNRYIIKK